MQTMHIYAVGVLVCERYLCGDGVGGGAGAAGQLLEGFLVKAHGVIAIEGHPDDGDGVQHVDYHGGHGQTEAFIWKVRVRHIATAPISAESTGTGKNRARIKEMIAYESQCP